MTVTKPILVEEVYRRQSTASVAIPETAPLRQVISKFAYEPGFRGLFLVDSHQRFVGAITRTVLLRWAQLQLGGVGKDYMSGEVFRLVFATKAKDVAVGDWRSLGVRTGDTVETALDQMIKYEVGSIPVLDSEGKIIGDLRLSEILNKVLELEKPPATETQQ